MDKGPPNRPGKTPPRLIADLIDYDPRRKSKNGRNLLADPAEWFRHDHLPPIRRGELDCKHALIRKDEQTDAPASDDVWPDTETKYTVAAYCSHCRYHFVITADFHTSASSQVICGPGKPNPLHHLILVDSTDAEEFRAEYDEDKYNTLTEAHRWLCSSATCPLEVVIKISPPRLNKSFLSLLEDPRKVDARGRKAIVEDPERYGEMLPRTPAEVLGVLTHYLKDAEAKAPNEMKKIAVRNKRFRLCFSDDCDSLFEYLDFGRYSETSIDPETEELITDYFWKLPEVTEINKNFIQDVVFELKLRIHDRPAKERMSTFMWSPFYATRDIERSLGYYNYPTRSRIIQLDASEEHPYYAGLGATENFTDDYLGWAYERQVFCDPDNKPYYLDCLEDLAKGRGSADLAEKFAMAKSVGAIGQKEIDEAYKSFALDQKNIEGDDHIIGVYNSRIEAAPRQKEQAKEALLVIGKARNSAKIQQVANDRTMTLEEAVEFLGVSIETSSDTIAAMAIVEAGEGTDKARIAGALRVISLARGGDYTLEESAANMEGTRTASTLGINEAYIRLQIRDNPHALHDENVWEYYLQSTSAGNEIAREAVQVIAEYRKSAYLKAKLANPDANVHSEMASADQPVGLQNIGNTCYLNSLLQFYYTVKTVRDVVIQFEDHRMSLAEDDISKKRVGGRVVKRSEIIKAQKFVDELRNLFLNLKSATRSVTPTKQLAELTLLSTEHEEDLIKRRMSISNPSGPPHQDPSDRPVFGPELPPPAMLSPPSLTPANPATDETKIESHSTNKNYDGDDSSEVTLVDMKDEQIEGTVVNGLGSAKKLSHSHLQPNGEPQDNIDMANTTSKTILDSPQLNGVSQPDKPPPVPPRNKAGLSIQTADIKQNNDLLTFGLQHDVTEVIGNVLFRLQCAIKPTSIDDNGGQRDAITDTFYGSNAVYTQKPEALDKKVEEWNSLIVYPPEHGSYGIYDALDVAFDQQKIESDKAITTQFASIHNLPPIVQIQINRPSFDKKTGQGYKNKCVVTFPETIYFDRYVDSDELDSGVMLRRKESWKLKAQLKRLEERLQVLEKEGVRDALAAAKEYLSNLQEADEEEVPDFTVESTTLVAALEARHDEVNKEIHQIHQKISKLKKKLQEQFTDFREYEYKLQAVFVHRGETISGGHYYIFIYDFDQNLWREYNDERVDPCPNTNKIFEQEKHGGGTPYLLSYVKSADLVDALHRDVPESKPQGVRFVNQTGPVKMLDIMSTSDYSALTTGENPETEHFENATAFLDSPEAHHRAILPKPEWENSGPDKTPGGNPW